MANDEENFKLLLACEQIVDRYDGPGTAQEEFKKLKEVVNSRVSELEALIKDLKIWGESLQDSKSLDRLIERARLLV